MKNNKEKKTLLEYMKKTPIVQVACERAHISRATYYRWRNEDKEFKKAADTAISEGESLITDMTESQLISLIRDRNFPAIQLWLRHHHAKYADRIELSGKLTVEEEPLTPEEEAIIKKALKLALPKISNFQNK
ncbi:MAG TPA: phBC6A51 family helix-turn-helix protein [Candidatus Paceibacterota bacterium]